MAYKASQAQAISHYSTHYSLLSGHMLAFFFFFFSVHTEEFLTSWPSIVLFLLPGTLFPLIFVWLILICSLDLMASGRLSEAINIVAVLVRLGCCNKMPETGWRINNRNVLVTGSWKSHIRVPTWSGSGEGPPQVAGFLCFLTWWKGWIHSLGPRL